MQDGCANSRGRPKPLNQRISNQAPVEFKRHPDDLGDPLARLAISAPDDSNSLLSQRSKMTKHQAHKEWEVASIKSGPKVQFQSIYQIDMKLHPSTRNAVTSLRRFPTESPAQKYLELGPDLRRRFGEGGRRFFR